MRMLLPALAAIALGGFCSQASAQAQCPELTRLRSEATEAHKPVRRGPMLPVQGNCDVYVRSSMKWRAVLAYADEHREMCGISTASLNDFEKYYRDAVRARDNVCSGRPIQPFPAEIIQR